MTLPPASLATALAVLVVSCADTCRQAAYRHRTVPADSIPSRLDLT